MTYDCPRCGKSVTYDSYGPCRDCVQELKDTAAIQGGFRNLILMIAGKKIDVSRVGE